MRIVCGAFIALYVAAFALLIIGTFGLFGQEQDPLSGVFLLPLGLPWNWLADKAGLGGPIPAIVAPAINLAILLFACRCCRRRRARKLALAAD
ncbi:hypothetical protein [Croceicoccus mobilis]|uniref:Uncharacterized protein n=1 Tax=Croceicoccus mobilis TaxID=1703339 RepID=A0A916YWI2_9SPHN|nr:hypothetical protein [Croceicoccus mobilis]GGD63143.1 hypothetical protein GCM10010990_10770 [Croceicoccus mobilis]